MTDISLNAKEDFEKVLNRYNKMIYRLAYARTGNIHDAEDILQEVFLRYVKSGMTFNDENHRKAWLLKVASNCSISLAASSWNKRRTDADTENGAAAEASSSESISELAEKSEISNKVRKAVLSLSEKYRTVVHLFYFEDMTVEEISKTMGITVSTVKTRLHRARKTLEERLKEVGINEWE